jgi:ABC-type sugar transport system permease subunit
MAFIKWCFMQMFSGTFDKLANFRDLLKRGAPDSIFACIAFILISLVLVIVITLIAAGLFDDINTVKNIGAVAFYTACFTLVYNIFKAAFECFMDDYEEPFRILKNKD